MSSANVPEFISVADYLAAEELSATKAEYIDGWVRAMSGGSNRHNRVKLNCIYRLMQRLEGQRCQTFDSDTKVRIRRGGLTRFYYPDAQVVCEPNAPADVYQDRPVLIIEVLSPSTRQYDLDEKLHAYLQIASLDVYIMLEQHQPLAIVQRRSPAGFLREVYEGVQATIAIPSLGCRLLLGDIYAGIEFTPTCVQEPEPEYEIR